MRIFFKSILGIIIICILGAVIFAFLGWSRLPDIVASRIAKTLKVAVEIGDISLKPNTIVIDNLEIGNPKGFQLEHAFTTQEIDIHAPLTRYMHNDIVIDEIDLKNVYIGLEFASPKGTSGNWTAIMSNAQDAQNNSSKSAAEKTVLIKRILLTNIQTDLLYQSEGKVRHLPTIPQIELTNVSSKGGNLTDQLMNSALGQMLKEIFIKENLKDIMDQIFQQIPGNSPIKGVLEPIKGLFNSVDKKEPNPAV